MINNTTIAQPHNVLADAAVVVVWSTMLLYGLIANCLIQIGIYRNPTMRTSTSYWFIISLSLCDIFMILISILHIIPATAFHDSFLVVYSLRNIWAIFFYDLFWYTGVLILGLMAVNRFVSIVYPTDYKQLFSARRTAYIIGSLYSVGTAVSVPTLFPCCHTLYDHNWYITTYFPEDSWYFIIDILVNSFTVILMIFCYSVILVKVRESRQAMTRYKLSAQKKQVTATQASTDNGAASPKNQHNQIIGKKSKDSNVSPPGVLSRREMKLFLQFFLVSLVFLLTWSTWQWLPKVSASKWVYFTLTSFFFINNGVNPTVYLIFNSTLRREVRVFLKAARASGTISNSASKERQDQHNQKLPPATSSTHLLKVASGIKARSSSCNSKAGLLGKPSQLMSPFSVSDSRIANRDDQRLIRNTKKLDSSTESSNGFRSPDALLEEPFREFMSAETIQDDPGCASSVRLSKENSGFSFNGHSVVDGSMKNLMSPMSLTPDVEDRLLSPIIRVNSIPIVKEKYELKLVNCHKSQRHAGNHVIIKLISSDSEIEPEDEDNDEVDPEAELLLPLDTSPEDQKNWKNYEHDKTAVGSVGDSDSEASDRLCLMKNESLSDIEWSAAAAQTTLVPIFSDEEELFIYTSTV